MQNITVIITTVNKKDLVDDIKIRIKEFENKLIDFKEKITTLINESIEEQRKCQQEFQNFNKKIKNKFDFLFKIK